MHGGLHTHVGDGVEEGEVGAAHVGVADAVVEAAQRSEHERGRERGDQARGRQRAKPPRMVPQRARARWEPVDLHEGVQTELLAVMSILHRKMHVLLTI